MLIKFYSDLHLEFSKGKFSFLHDSIYDKDTVLLLAGDIGLASQPYEYIPFLEHCSDRFREILMVSGNHEHYGSHINETHNRIKRDTAHIVNFSLIEMGTMVIEDIAFIGTTLWTDMDNKSPLVIFDAEENMNDYKEIYNGTIGGSYKKKILSPFTTISLFEKSKEFIFNELKKHQDRKTVVLSHHAPSFKSIDKKYVGDSMGLYATDLSNEILDNVPDIWIHGHVHNTFDYMIGDTRVISNPRGYEPKKFSKACDLNPLFQPNMLIEI